MAAGTAYLSTSYLPSIDYISTLLRYDRVLIEACESYPKQTYRNRCRIASAGGVQTLTVPVEKPEGRERQTRDIRISDHGNWRHIHWNALVSAYNLSPFFEYYADDFRKFYDRKYKYLLDYNTELLSLICSILGVNVSTGITDCYAPLVENDYRNTLTSRNQIVGIQYKPYYQVFARKNGFISNLSIVDLLFNMGNEAIIVLQQCCGSAGNV
jgi:hypothetical protein